MRILSACGGDDGGSRTAVGPIDAFSSGGSGRVIEEEIFGDVTTTDSSGWTAYLVPARNLPDEAMNSMEVSFDYPSGWDWGWFDVAGDGPCEGGVGSGEEVHNARDSGEKHCVEAGTWFRFDLEKDDVLRFRRPIDYPAWTLVYAGDDTFFVDDKYATGGGAYFDVIASYAESGTDTLVPGVEISAAQEATSPSWTALQTQLDDKYHLPINFTLRIGAWPTTTTAVSRKHVLVRYFWKYDVDSTTATRFYSPALLNTHGLARTYRYVGAPPFNRTIRAHFVLPHQVPSPVSDTTVTDYGKTLDLSLRIDSAFTAIISVDDTVVVGDSVSFTDTGLDGAGIDSLTWDFGDGSDTTAAAPTHVFDTTGTMTVVLRKYNVYDGIVYEDTTVVVVLPALDAGVIVGSYHGWPTNNEIEENGDCMWEVTPTGGTGSYTYVWQKKWKPWWSTIPGETTQELYIADVGSSDFELRTIISSGPLADTTDVLSMTVAFRGQVCIIRK
jgi:hypothetical protein